MKPTYNLIDQPWIPCVKPDGSLVELSINEALAQAHDLAAIEAESPVNTAAIYRLLLAILHRVLGPSSRAEWADLWVSRRKDMAALGGYLERWRHRFDLFDEERPFYQVRDDRVLPKSVLSMVFEMASGNNATLFDHHTEEGGLSLQPPQAARALLAYQAFGLSGICHPQKKLFYTYAPCAGGILFLVEGNSLFETLLLNLLRYSENSPDGNLCAGPDDLPAWEQEDPYLPERRVPFGYLDYLTWQNRRILMIPEETSEGWVVRKATVAPGLVLDPTILDPMKHYRKSEEYGFLALRFDEGRMLWRDSAALFRLRDDALRTPLAFRWVADLVYSGVLESNMRYRNLAMGMASNQAKVEFIRLERMPLPLAYLKDEQLVAYLGIALSDTETVRQKLVGAVYEMAALLLSTQSDHSGGRKPDKKDVNSLVSHWGVERQYWSQLEVPFYQLLEDLPSAPEERLAEWKAHLRRSAWEILVEIEKFAGSDAPGLKAVVRARGKLAGGLKALTEALVA